MIASIDGVGPNTIWIFLGLTCVLGGAAAYASGRALALTWRPFWMAPAYALALAAAVRFLHYALYEEPLVSAPLFAADAAVLVAIAALGFRMTRARQMRERYGWMGAQ
jgi:hypothetical protein